MIDTPFIFHHMIECFGQVDIESGIGDSFSFFLSFLFVLEFYLHQNLLDHEPEELCSSFYVVHVDEYFIT